MPTDTFTQIIAQAMGGSGYAMAFVLAAAFLLMLCVVGIIGSVLEARQRRIDDEQRRLERSVRRARSEAWASQNSARTGSYRR